MAAPEGAGTGREISKISSPGEARVPVISRPDVRPAPVSPKPEKPQPSRKPLINRLANNLVLRIALSGALAGTGYAAYQEVPAVHESVDTLGEKVAEAWRSFSQPQTIEERFPIALPQSGFTPISPEEEKNLWQNTKTADLENHTFTIGFPVDQTTIDKSPNLRIATELFYPMYTPLVDRKKLEQEDVRNLVTISGLPQGTEYKVIYDDTKFDASVILLTAAGVTIGEGSDSFIPAYTSYRLLFRDKETGAISFQEGVSGLLAEPLVTTNPYPKNYHAGYEDGTPIKSGDPIMKLTTDLKDWDGKTGQPLSGEKGQFQTSVSHEEQSPYDSRVMFGMPLTTSFLKTPNDNLAVHQ